MSKSLRTVYESRVMWLKSVLGTTLLLVLMLAVSQSALAQPGSPPATPARPTVNSLAHNSVTISWTDPGDSSITGYQVLRRNPAIHKQREFVVVEDDTGASTTNYTDTTVSPETKYFYRVKARNAHGLSKWSKVAKATTPADPTPPNTAPTGLPTTTGTVRVGETLGVDTSGISDKNGLTNAQYTYQWVRSSRGTDTEITGATSSTYVLTPDDQGNAVKARVSFTDDDGYSETLTSAASGAVARPANVAATGQPIITGTVQEGETLSADTSGINDSNGLTNVQYSYQWIRSDGGTDTDITGATSSTYVLTPDDTGKVVKARVSFTDDDGYSETLTSAASGAVARPANVAATGQPIITGTAQVGETLSADTSGINDSNGLTNVQYSYQWIRSDGGTDTDITGATSSTYVLTPDDTGKVVKVRVSFTDDDGYSETLTSAASGAVARPANVAATGQPIITGTAQVGETLSADTSGISDANGLTNVQYTYQWVRIDGSTDTDIAGATSSTYVLTPDDTGKAVKVRVSFTDDDGYSETLTSAATGTVAPITIVSTTTPANPARPTIDSVTHDSVTLRWRDPGDSSITSYQVLRRNPAVHDTGEFVIIEDDTGSPNTSYTDTDVDPDTEYLYRVKARNAHGLSGWSGFVKVSTLFDPTPDLTQPIDPPEHIAYTRWSWSESDDFEVIEVEFTIHTEAMDMPGWNGMYLMLCYGHVDENAFYFGMQFDDRGERAIFSRWGERDLAMAQPDPDEAWTTSSGDEGNFIGVRRQFDWEPGEYVARLAPDGEAPHGEWYGLWITDVDTQVTTWIGSLWFPDKGITDAVYSTVEVYGTSEIRPMDIAEVYVSINRPLGDGVAAASATTDYTIFDKYIPNSEIRGTTLGVDIWVGGDTVRTTAPAEVTFDR